MTAPMHILFFVVSTTLAAPPAASGPVQDYAYRVSESTGRAPEEVRVRIIEYLSGHKQIKKEDLARIGRGEEPLESGSATSILSRLKNSGFVRFLTGLPALNNQKIERMAERAFEAAEAERVALDASQLIDAIRRAQKSLKAGLAAEELVALGPLNPGLVRRVFLNFLASGGESSVARDAYWKVLDSISRRGDLKGHRQVIDLLVQFVEVTRAPDLAILLSRTGSKEPAVTHALETAVRENPELARELEP